MDFRPELASGLNAVLERAPVEREIQAFGRYLSLLLQWNRVHSLTAYREPTQIMQKLFLDSLLFLRVLPPRVRRLLDLGSGAGIPGIPLKIVEPAWDVTLIEARRRRTSFLTTVARELELQGIRVLTGRAEALIKELPDLEGVFDAVVTRASGRPDQILPVALRFLKPGGRLVASGPPASRPLEGAWPGSWQIISSPLSGQPRRFLTIEKT